MKVLLVPAFNFVKGIHEPYVPAGLLTLQSLESRVSNVQVDIAKLTAIESGERFSTGTDVVQTFLNSVRIDQYDCVGFSTVCNSVHYALECAAIIKKTNPRVKLFVGGPYVTKLAQQVIDGFPFLDAVFVGEAEDSFSSFLERCAGGVVDFNGIPGVWTPTAFGGCTSKTANLDLLPMVTEARDYVPWLDIERGSRAEPLLPPIEATRGCPLQCSFCSTKQVWGAKVRRKSARRLMEEMSNLHRLTGDRVFSFTGDNVGVPRNPFLSFCSDLVEYRNPFYWVCSLKLDRMTRDDLSLMWQAGCRGMFVGIETASQETLRLVNKAARLDHEIEGIKLAIDMGFMVETSFIIGFPWETEEELRSTYNLHCEFLALGAKRSQIGILSPIPGTEIVVDANLISDSIKASFASDGISLSEFARKSFKQFPKLFTHFSRYETPNVSPQIVRAYRDAGAHMAALREKYWRGNSTAYANKIFNEATTSEHL